MIAPPPRAVAGPLPGLCLAAAIAGLAVTATLAIPPVSALIWAIALGAAVGPKARRMKVLAPGLRFTSRRVLRVGVALIGLQVSLGDVADLGAGGLGLVCGTVAATLAGTLWLGRLLGVDRRLVALIAAGTSICGAAAIAATESVTGATEEQVAYAVATVTLLGTIAMLVVPLAGLHVLDLGTYRTGLWAGASIHEVAQVAGAGAVISAAALKSATIVKLARVMLLAPVVAGFGAAARERRQLAIGQMVPAFVVAFLALVCLRSAVDLPTPVLSAAKLTATTLIAAALAALGTQIQFGALLRAGPRPLALALAAWLLAATVALALVFVTT